MFAKQYIRTLLTGVALILGTLAAEAQSRSVTGTVFNDDGKTLLVGCTIIVQGTTTGTTTEANGSYSSSNRWVTKPRPVPSAAARRSTSR